MSLYHSTENRTWMVSPSLPSVHICEMESGIALEFLQGNRASIHIEGGIQWCFSSSDEDLRESLMLPQEVRPTFKLQETPSDSS